MQLKPITAIAVLLLVVASLLVAGCTTSTTSNTNQTPSATSSTATHDAFLVKFIDAFKNRVYSDKNYSIKAWDLTWINGTSARVELTMQGNTTTTANYTANMVITCTAFPTSQDATNHLNTMNKTGYSLVTSQCSNSSSSASGGAYQDASGHAPQICKDYERSEGNSSSISEYREYHIYQLDNLIIEATLKLLE
jgi:hypothetical protein